MPSSAQPLRSRDIQKPKLLTTKPNSSVSKGRPAGSRLPAKKYGLSRSRKNLSAREIIYRSNINGGFMERRFLQRKRKKTIKTRYGSLLLRKLKRRLRKTA